MDRETWCLRRSFRLHSLFSNSAILIFFVKLEDLFVDPSFRGGGVGKALFAELGKVAEEKVSFCAPTLTVSMANAELRTAGVSTGRS